MITGTLFGIIGFGIVGLGRIIGNTAMTSWHLFANITTLAIDNGDKETIFGKDARTHNFQKYVLGFPGIILGTMAGIGGFITVGLGRIIGNSAITTWHLFGNITTLAIDEGNKEAVFGKDNRTSNVQKYGFGFPGLIFGTIFGVIGFGVVGAGRIVGNTVLTAWHVFAEITNLALAKRDKKANFGTDDRKNIFQKYVLGFPGLFIGAIAGIGGFLVVGVYRVIGNSALTTWHTFGEISTRALINGNKQALFGQDSRDSIFQKYILGLPGLIIGTITGIISYLLISAIRIIEYNRETAVRAFSTALNLSLDHKLKPALEQNDSRAFGVKYGLGFIGLVMGGGIGLMGATIIGTGKCIQQSGYSWYHLSGSLLNLSLGHPLFAGLSGDQRIERHRWMGAFGYLAAVCTTGLVGLIYVIGKNIAVAGAFLLGVVCGFIVAPVKGAHISKHPRFEPQKTKNTNSDEYIADFKNLYSSLGTWGRFAEDRDIKTNSNGGKGIGCFVRKSITFNISSLSERVLDSVFDAYQHSANKATFFNSDNPQMKTALDKVKQHYKSLDGWLETEAEILERDAQIDDIGSFVTNYVHSHGQQKHVPASLYKRHQFSMQDQFFGKKLERISATAARTTRHHVPRTPAHNQQPRH